MPTRPGDSAPNFDRFERHPPGDGDHDPATDAVAEAAAADEHGLPDSHVFQMPMMVPHFSDGTTDVLIRGRNPAEEPVSEHTEPMFPRQMVPEEAFAGDEERTIELPRVPAAEVVAPR